MSKSKVLVVIGGQSTEHTVSRMSGTSVVRELNKDKYEAAVSYGHNNLRFKNTTKKNIVFDLYTSKGRVVVAAYQVL